MRFFYLFIMLLIFIILGDLCLDVYFQIVSNDFFDNNVNNVNIDNFVDSNLSYLEDLIHENYILTDSDKKNIVELLYIYILIGQFINSFLKLILGFPDDDFVF